ncbi:MAG TPA: amidohydrolase [Anaerovoracaceae bacterium]|nr:amidohydrolase [Anaerovoracaceae bacterium]
MDEIKEKAFAWQKANADMFYELADEIWKNPELGMKEVKSSRLLADILRNDGFQVETGVADMPTAFVAVFGSGEPVIAFNAEYDALPKVSQKVSTERSPVVEEGPGHGCGHNVLGTASVKAAISLKNILKEEGLNGTVKVFGTPAEELCIGKPFMAAAGLFKGVDVFLDWHPKFMNRSYAEGCNAYFSVKYHFHGKSSHGNMPWLGNSAFDAAMLQAHAVELLREHIHPGDPPEGANTINYVFSTGGLSYPNVVPDHTTAWYVGRFVTSELLQEVLAKIDRCAEAAAMATGTTVEREFVTASHEKICNEVISKVLSRNLEEAGAPSFAEEEQCFVKALQKNAHVTESGLDESIIPYGKINGAVQDTSEYSWFAPYGLLRLTMGPANLGWHNWVVTACAGSSVAHKTLDCAARILTASAIDILSDAEILRKAKAEWNAKVKEKEYLQLIPDGTKPDLGICNS